MLEFFELEEKNGYVSLYENHITINKSLMEYLKEAYRWQANYLDITVF